MVGRLAPALLALLLATGAAEGGSYAMDHFAVQIVVNDDASLTVRETIRFAFTGHHQGIFRTIPIRYERGGVEHVLRVDGIQALDERGAPLRTEVTWPGRYVKIKVWVPGAEDAIRPVTLLYRVQRALRAFDDHDELYWNVTGTEWGAPIRAAEAVVSLPRGVRADAVRTVAYTGPAGAAGQDFTISPLDDFVTFTTTRPLRMREGLTVVVGWPPGHVRFPSRAQELAWLLLDQRWFALPLAILGACLFIWQRAGRDPLGARSVRPEYAPPADLRPGEMGALVDEIVHPRDIVATVVDLAVRGYLEIERADDGAGGADYVITGAKPWLGDADVRPFEVLVLAQIFGPAAGSRMRMLSEMRRDSSVVVQRIARQLYRDLADAGYFVGSPDAVRRRWRLAGGLVIAAFVTLYQADWASGPMLMAGVVSGLVVALFASAMPRRTPRGAVARHHVLGFQEFLDRAEKDRLRRLPPDTLHRWLPYAIALGVEEAWIAGFGDLTVGAPGWYRSKTPFSLGSYSSELRRFEREAQTAWTSTSRGGGRSGGSGFSGGSSGGGRGGGGGGTF